MYEGLSIINVEPKEIDNSNLSVSSINTPLPDVSSTNWVIS